MPGSPAARLFNLCLVVSAWALAVGPTTAALPVARSHEGQWVTIVEDDFEGEFPGPWDVGGHPSFSGEYHWQPRDCRVLGGSYSAWAVGGGTDGSLLACGSEYPNYLYSYMVHGPFSLEDATAAEMTFQLWLRSEPLTDLFYYQYSTTGQYFWGSPALSGDTGGWVPMRLDLAEVVGEPQVWVAFIFLADEDVQEIEGAYVDNVLLRKHVGGETPTPTPTATLPVPNHRVYLPVVTKHISRWTAVSSPPLARLR